MNERIIKLGLDSYMLNYIDNETPRRYFLSAYADEDDLQKFAELIVKECVEVIKWTPSQFPNDEYVKNIKEHFGVKE